MRTAGIILTAAAGLLLAAAAPAETPAWRQITVFRPHDQAVAEAFAAADSAWAETWHPDDAERLALADALGDAVPEPEFTFHRASGDGVSNQRFVWPVVGVRDAGFIWAVHTRGP